MRTKEDWVKMVKASKENAFKHRDDLKITNRILQSLYDISVMYQFTPRQTLAAWAELCGDELCKEVLATKINASSWDERISHDVKEWALSEPLAWDESSASVLCVDNDSIHRAHLSQIAEAGIRRWNVRSKTQERKGHDSPLKKDSGLGL